MYLLISQTYSLILFRKTLGSCHYHVDREAISVPGLHHIPCVPIPSCTGQSGPRSAPELRAGTRQCTHHPKPAQHPTPSEADVQPDSHLLAHAPEDQQKKRSS